MTRELHPAVKALLGAADRDRIAFIRKSKWIGYEAADTLLAELEELFDHPTCSRMPNMLMISDTNNGKTEILNAFLRKHPFVNDENAEVLCAPVIYIQAPPEPREERLYKAILNAIGALSPESANASRRLNQILTILPQVSCRMLIIDEIHDLLGGSTNQHHQMLKAVKHLSNALKIPIVGAGIDVAFNVFQSEAQLSNRFTVRVLPKWSRTMKGVGPFEQLLATLETLLPLRKASNLASDSIAGHLRLESEGLLGELVRLVSDASVKAIKSGSEKITLSLLQELPFVGPSGRRKALAGDAA
jgi:hypothetical protein